jgi:dienelactone hydrolase
MVGVANLRADCLRSKRGVAMRRLVAAIALVWLTASGTPSIAQAPRQTVALVLIPGAGGLHPLDFLVMSRPVFEAAGFTIEYTTSATQAASLIAGLKGRNMRVVLVGMSLGAVTAAQVVASGAQPDAVVFAAGGLFPPGTPNGSVVETLGDPSRLPRTLIVHHREDECMMTPPEAVPDFLRWSRGKARVSWITGGGGFGPPCRANTPHAFSGRTAAAAGAIVQFARAGR